MGNGLISRLTAWAKQPFTTSMDIGSWAVFVLFIICVCIFWTRVLRDVGVD
jgi:hypothetical protein